MLNFCACVQVPHLEISLLIFPSYVMTVLWFQVLPLNTNILYWWFFHPFVLNSVWSQAVRNSWHCGNERRDCFDPCWWQCGDEDMQQSYVFVLKHTITDTHIIISLDDFCGSTQRPTNHCTWERVLLKMIVAHWIIRRMITWFYRSTQPCHWSGIRSEDRCGPQPWDHWLWINNTCLLNLVYLLYIVQVQHELDVSFWDVNFVLSELGVFNYQQLL